MAFQRLLYEGQCCSFITGFGDEALEDFSFVINGAPEVVHLAVDLHVHLIEMPSPVGDALHPADPLPTNVACKHRTEAVPPEPDSLVAKVDTALEQQILDIPQRERKADIHHDHQADHLGRRVEAAKGTRWFCSGFSFHA